MADISGIGGFDVTTTRSAFDAEAAAQRRAEERDRQEELAETRRAEAAQEEARSTEQTDTDQDATAQNAQQDDQDTVTISNAAQQFITQAEDETEAANDDAVAAAQGVNAAQQTTQVGGVNGTNQTTADEENNATVNGNQDDQSEQTRALGQIVDQFA